MPAQILSGNVFDYDLLSKVVPEFLDNYYKREKGFYDRLNSLIDSFYLKKWIIDAACS